MISHLMLAVMLSQADGGTVAAKSTTYDPVAAIDALQCPAAPECTQADAGAWSCPDVRLQRYGCVIDRLLAKDASLTEMTNELRTDKPITPSGWAGIGLSVLTSLLVIFAGYATSRAARGLPLWPF